MSIELTYTNDSDATITIAMTSPQFYPNKITRNNTHKKTAVRVDGEALPRIRIDKNNQMITFSGESPITYMNVDGWYAFKDNRTTSVIQRLFDLRKAENHEVSYTLNGFSQGKWKITSVQDNFEDMMTWIESSHDIPTKISWSFSMVQVSLPTTEQIPIKLSTSTPVG